MSFSLLAGMTLAACISLIVLTHEHLRKNGRNKLLAGTFFTGKDVSARNAVVCDGFRYLFFDQILSDNILKLWHFRLRIR